MKKLKVLLALIAILLLPAGVFALDTRSGGEVIISSPVYDDLFASGGSIILNAPVDSAILAGGTIEVNAPIKGDLIAAGGTIRVNADVGGKIVLAGGSVLVNGSVGTNAIATGGEVTLLPGATVTRDALISGGTVKNEGYVDGTLTVDANQFQNTGHAGSTNVHINENSGTLPGALSAILVTLSLLFALGMFILGLVLIKTMPSRFFSVTSEVRKSPVIKTVIGFIGLLIGIIGLTILAITVVGLPLAMLAGMVFLIAVLLSSLFVAYRLGEVIATHAAPALSEWQRYTIGFVILFILFYIPFIGPVILVIAISLGFGAFLYALHDQWPAISGSPPKEKA
jgi:cytoskeletal protein CcmA (bactofilin family)